MALSTHVSEWGLDSMKPEEYNIDKSKFVLVNENKKLRDKELVTKPVGFFKDAMYRFAKNKGSIVGAIVIGVLVLYAIIVPIFSQYTVSYRDNYYSYILPKVFNSEKVDFLDGAKKETSNLTTFIEHYSKGLETGHNAIKRQEYSYNPDKDMYTYRLDSYQAVGTVFINSFSRQNYYRLQEYQDKTGIQIIYPITDPTKRPKSEKNLTNANIWYETVEDENSSNDIPVNYTIKEDGTIELKNIYQKFSTPIMSSSSKKENAAVFILETSSDASGYNIRVVYKAGRDYNGSALETDMTVGYVQTRGDGEINFSEIVDQKADASTFYFDNTYNTLKVYIDGHEDASEDGYYFFGLPKSQGSTADLLSVDELGNDNNIPFSLYENDTIVTSPIAEKEYFFAANRISSQTGKFFAGSFNPISNVFSITNSFTNANKLTLTPSGSGYLLSFPQRIGDPLYFVVSANNDETVITTSNVAANGSIFTFDASNKALSINVSGHTTASLDGDYYFAYRVGASTSSAGSLLLAKEADINNDDSVYFFNLVSDNTFTPATAIDTTLEYSLFISYDVTVNSFYFADGEFKGDNYFSKMRVEGEDNYLYDYAIQKNGGNQYEIRVNYYEYYKYYHSQILKDKITEPFFLFGTTASGQDIFTCLASGARFSFIMAIIVATVNLIVGAIYGAIEGYYGGKVDMIMERIVEILSAVPFMIVITLLKYHLKTPQFIILFIAFFLTGWIGMSGTVRMQFYRFKNQEYVLAARTLGARDPRIMFKHIFPNALGTIVTSCVLVIPGMIFSETSLSYLGIINLNSGNMTSVGTLLAGGQPYLVQYPHMILYPAIFISLLMLCFNLFGNGLRDAFNPSLRGTED